ncbi:FecR family protein [Chitinophaga sp. RAB17]|uniref:FecR family protein n=1 Tax=Chitinophaga sp. RAB17 TaxID=3233049 RepID=UPI003F8F736D
MDTPDKDINWDKLLSALEDGNTTPLNEEEAAMLRAAKEMKDRVKVAAKFPAEEGWQHFVIAKDARKMKMIWRRRIAVAAAAAALLITAGVWSWQQRTPKPQIAAISKADQPAVTQVQLVMSNGKTITLGNNVPVTQDNNGTQVQVDSTGIVYQAGRNKHAVNVMDTLHVPRGNQIRIELSDETGVWVNADSKLVYPATFNGDTREVWVQGEAYFDVAPNAQQPFVVHAGSTSVQVLGTSFNISTYVTIQTTLTSGKVSVSAGTGKAVLSPGQQSSYNVATGKLQLQSVETRVFTAWKDGDIYFEETNLSDILNGLGRSFDYDFKFEDTTLEKLNITLDMHKPATLQPVLDHIRLTIGNIKFRVQGRTVFVSRP